MFKVLILLCNLEGSPLAVDPNVVDGCLPIQIDRTFKTKNHCLDDIAKNSPRFVFNLYMHNEQFGSEVTSDISCTEEEVDV